MNNKAFTIVEMLSIIVILGILLVLVLPNIIGISDKEKTTRYNQLLDNINLAAETYISNEIKNPTYPMTIQLQNLIDDGYIKTPLINPITELEIDYNNYVLINKKIDGTLEYTTMYQLDPSGANFPILATGMIPVYYDGGWKKASNTNSDLQWFDYSNKKWANAVTVTDVNRDTYLAAATGTPISETDILTYMVWIPRYGYQIASGYHLSTVGTINAKFLTGTTNTTIDSTPIASVPTYSGSSQTNYIQHPAFLFGTTELTGFWFAKFEASGTTVDVNSKPNNVSLKNLTIGTVFDATRNMETNARFGWGTTGTYIDTHLVKNREWGAVAYLSKSIYGKNTEEIWMNPENTYKTGCAGSSINSSPTSGCSISYSTTNGVNASTTGNIYGIYDMSGGAIEFVSAYINNGNANLAANGNSILTASAQYKDVYPVTSDIQGLNYDNAINIKGDAVYETSNSGALPSSAWNQDDSAMPLIGIPWFIRSGDYSQNNACGVFHFRNNSGAAYTNIGFRFALIVSSNF